MGLREDISLIAENTRLLATRVGQFVKQRGLPGGGTDGQVLAKKSISDYDTEWKTPSAGGGGSSLTTPFLVSFAKGLPSGAQIENSRSYYAVLGTGTAANQLHLSPFAVPYETRISALAINVSTAAASDTGILIGIYESFADAAFPETLVASGQVQSGTTTGEKTLSLDFTFKTDKLYFLACLIPSVIQTRKSGSSPTWLAVPGTSGGSFSANLSRAFSSGLPATLAVPTINATNFPQSPPSCFA